MVFILGLLSLCIGIVIIVVTISGAPNDINLWLVGIAFIASGVAAPALKIYRDKKLESEAADHENKRRTSIRAHQSEWGQDVCRDLISRRISIDMTQEMVKLSLGAPDTIDQQEITRTRTKERWIYGQPRKNATYIWFTNGKVTKIKT
jgi:hypothetical protein